MSQTGKKQSAIEMHDAQEKKVSAALEQVFRHFSDAGPINKDQRTRDFVFHMTDWYADLVKLNQLFANPDTHTAKEWDEAVSAFLIHAVGHGVEAARLMDLFSDPFKRTSLKKLKASASI